MTTLAARVAPTVVALAVSSALVAACGAAPDEASDADGAVVVEWSLSSTPEPRLGGVDEDTVSLLYGVRGAFLRAGEIVVANSGTHEVKVFDARTGRVLRAFGGEGGGPGEFAALAAVAPLGADSIVALDGDLRRVTVFGAEGEPARTIGLDRLPARVSPDGLHALGARTLLLMTYTGSRPSDAEGAIRHSAPYLRLPVDGAALDTLGVFPGESWLRIRLPGGASVVTYLPFGPATRADAAGGRVFVGDGESYEVAVLDTLGRTLSTIRGPVSPRPVSAEVRRRFEAARLESAPPARRAQMARLYESIPYPDRMPAYDRIRIDAVTDELWVRRYPGPGAEVAEWDVFDATAGTRRASVSFDADFEVLDIVDSRLVVLYRDELDRERIGVYAVGPTTGG